MAKKKSKDTTLQDEVKMEDMPSEGQKVYYVDHRGTSGVLVATVNSVDHDASTADLVVQDLNASGGCFAVMASAHDESMSPGTWHYPK